MLQNCGRSLLVGRAQALILYKQWIVVFSGYQKTKRFEFEGDPKAPSVTEICQFLRALRDV
jgi:hypothetical protein